MKTAHTASTGQTYFQHLLFAVGVGIKLLMSSLFFITHGFVPWVPIPGKFNLKEMGLLLLVKNQDLKTRKEIFGGDV